MTTADKRKAALAALANHARRYKVTIPERIKAFYAGDFDRYHLQHVIAHPSGYGKSPFQLALTPPTWLNKGDDAINGPRGEWEDAKYHVPLFVADQDLYAVVNIKNPEHPVGWYQEESNSSDGPGKGFATLDAFLAALTRTPGDGDVMTPANPDQEMDWAEDFGDDSARAFDVAGGDDD